nr:3-dehydroquinate synthase [Chloroflexota bacterium]
MNIILYGPPGAGKTSVGRALAARLGREFVDADPLIEARAGRGIPEIFSQRGEAEFRRLESEVCAELAARDYLIVAPGGGALLNPANRAALERRGLLVCLRAAPAALLARLQAEGNRPLLAGGDPAQKLNALLDSRRALYDSFPEQIDTTGRSVPQVAEEIAALLAPRALAVNAPGLQHEIVLGYGLLNSLPVLLTERGFTGPTVTVTDENVAPFIVRRSPLIVLPAGERHKTLDTMRTLYDAFLKHGLDRGGVVIAVGGGVVGDMAGFAAATFMRGVRWVNVPTTLLAMVDASLGGKTGVDLPQGKNLVGAFHPPSLVVSDPLALNTLPHGERVSGMAEVIKHGVIGDAALFEVLETSLTRSDDFSHRATEVATTNPSVQQIQQAIEVKIKIVEADPFEKGQRATLNLGHTVGHGVEAASGYTLRHGEAVSIGMAAECQLAVRLGLAEGVTADRVTQALARAGLPTTCPGLDPARIREAMNSDKKKAGGRLKFALPKRIGEVAWGVEVDEALLRDVLKAIAD